MERWISSHEDQQEARRARDEYAETLVQLGLTPSHTVGLRRERGVVAVYLHVEEDANV